MITLMRRMEHVPSGYYLVVEIDDKVVKIRAGLNGPEHFWPSSAIFADGRVIAEDGGADVRAVRNWIREFERRYREVQNLVDTNLPLWETVVRALKSAP